MVFTCNFCGKEFHDEQKRDEHWSRHYKDTKDIPVKSKKRNKGGNLLEKWKS